MPKIFVLRHQLAEQQARLRQNDKGGESSNGSPSLSSDEETRPGETVVVQPSVLLAPAVLHQQPEVSDILQRPPPGLVIQPIPAPPQPQTSAASTSSTAAGKHT